MTTARQMAANRKNASASTGPKTADGKATVGHNARKHGVTSQLDPERVGLWARIIMDQADMSLQVAMNEHEGMDIAWALAQAEVRLNTVTEVLNAEKISLVALTDNEKVRGFSASFTERAIRYLLGQASPEEIEEFQKKRTSFDLKRKIEENQEIDRRRRLMRRYYREAVSARRKAFRHWVDWLERSQREAGPAAYSAQAHKNHGFPETKPISI